MLFKNIKEESESTWEDSARVLGKFISTELNRNYTDELYRYVYMFITKDHDHFGSLLIGDLQTRYVIKSVLFQEECYMFM